MRSLFDISDDLLALGDLFAEVGGEISEDEAGDALERWFDEIGTERDIKIDNYCALINELDARAKARQEEANRINQLASVDIHSVKRLKARLKAFFEVQGLTKVETSRFKISVAKNGGIQPMLIPDAWEKDPPLAPEQFHRRIIQLDRDAIRTAIEAGETVEGCSLVERGTHLRIK